VFDEFAARFFVAAFLALYSSSRRHMRATISYPDYLFLKCALAQASNFRPTCKRGIMACT
jgi:hypothetical protein